MRKSWVLGAAAVFLFSGVLAAQEMSVSKQPAEGRHERIAREAQRNKELLEIWKEHVRTLTEERNAAYKELEVLKLGQAGTNSPARQFGAIEAQPTLPSGALQNMQELQSQLGALRSQNEMIQRELNEVRKAPPPPSASYRDLLNRYQEQKKQLADLKNQAASLESENDRLKTELQNIIEHGAASQTASPETGELARQRDDAQRQVRELTYQNDTLRAKNEKLKVAEKELEDTRAYLTPLIKNLEQKNKALETEIGGREEASQSFLAEKASWSDSIRNLNRALQANEEKLQNTLSVKADVERRNEELQSSVSRLSTEIQRLTPYEAGLEQLKSQTDQLSKEKDEWVQKSESLQKLYADVDFQNREKQADLESLTKKLKDVRTAHQSLLAERDSLKTRIQELAAIEERAKAADHELGLAKQEIEELMKSNADLQNSNSELKNRLAQQAKSVETLKASLHTNLSDIQNLKANLESYLESLVSNFEERQR